MTAQMNNETEAWDALNEKYPSDGDTYRDMARAALQAAQKEQE